MATNEADLGYGPTPPDAQHEHTDIEPSIATKFGIWLTISMLISVGIVYGTFWFFEGREAAASRAAQKYPLAVGQVREPPTPRLQTQPFKDIYVLRQHEQTALTTYGWIDQPSGIVRLPIDRAMELTLQRGLPARSGGDPSQAGQIVEDSSAGRTYASR